jgi:hypothetical protein
MYTERTRRPEFAARARTPAGRPDNGQHRSISPSGASDYRQTGDVVCARMEVVPDQSARTPGP